MLPSGHVILYSGHRLWRIRTKHFLCKPQPDMREPLWSWLQNASLVSREDADFTAVLLERSLWRWKFIQFYMLVCTFRMEKTFTDLKLPKEAYLSKDYDYNWFTCILLLLFPTKNFCLRNLVGKKLPKGSLAHYEDLHTTYNTAKN